jgi:aspartyl protease family protein
VSGQLAGGSGDDVVRGSLKTIVLIALIAGLVIIIERRGAVIAVLRDRDFAALLYQIGILVLVGALMLRLFRSHFAEAFQAALIWAIIALLLLVAYAYRFELKEVGERVLAELVPGRAIARGQTVEIARSAAGDFLIPTEVNGIRVPMVLDTGATSVMLTRDAAIAAGLPVEMIRYTVNVETANGRAQAAAVNIDSIAIGGIVERSVPALIAQPGQLKMSLLGMSFLARLKSWEMRGDHVVLRGTKDDRPAAEDRARSAVRRNWRSP